MTEVRLGLRTSSTGGVDHCLLSHSEATKTASSTPSPEIPKNSQEDSGEEVVVANPKPGRGCLLRYLLVVSPQQPNKYCGTAHAERRLLYTLEQGHCTTEWATPCSYW